MRIGDLCEIDADGYLRVVGRTSDIIIRGGKNISAPAVEAEVAEPSRRSRWRRRCRCPTRSSANACASTPSCSRTSTLELDELVAYLRERGVSPEWFPERLVVVDALPRASGGKVAKGELRADIRRRLDDERIGTSGES